MQVSRRELFKYVAAGSCAAGLSVIGATGAAHADPGLGTLIDYSAGVPSARSILAAGHAGAIRYVSDRRPGAEWMLGKPLQRTEADDFTAAGLEIASCYQFGKAETADWRGGFEAGVHHATRGWALHLAAGGPANRPIYASIDDNPTAADFTNMIAPYLLGWHSVIGKENTGVYANSHIIDLAQGEDLGSWYWMHNWGTPKGYVHPAAHLHQVSIEQPAIDGITVDINVILKPDYGQWSLG